MLFPTFDFGVFFLIVFAVSWWLFPLPVWRKLVLVGASYFFYGYWDWRFCFLLLASSAVNYAAGMLLHGTAEKPKRKIIVGVAVALNLGFLAFFKYYGFFVTSLNDLMFDLGLERELPFLEIILPVGISFFTFQGISYVIDVYRGHVAATRSLLNILLYISFFPQLVAGPIVRAAHFLPQIEAQDADDAPRPDRILASLGLLLIIIGLFKKVILANYLATEMVDIVFFDPYFYGALDLLLAIWGYTIQIYCDFSAYSDIAIGVAALLGYRFQRNFDQPYRSESIREFWRRWHISLSTWLRDYLYIPLGGGRGGIWKTRRNLMITMVLGGLWHGAAWNYVIWGFLHGLAMAVEDVFGLHKPAPHRAWWKRAIAIAVVFHFLCLTFIIFRSESMEIAWTYAQGFLDFQTPSEFLRPFIVVLLFVGFALHFIPHRVTAWVEGRYAGLPILLQAAVLALAIIVIDACGPDGVAPFIYFQF